LRTTQTTLFLISHTLAKGIVLESEAPSRPLGAITTVASIAPSITPQQRLPQQDQSRFIGQAQEGPECNQDPASWIEGYRVFIMPNSICIATRSKDSIRPSPMTFSHQTFGRVLSRTATRYRWLLHILRPQSFQLVQQRTKMLE
jgi:hypothetical protein